MSAQTTVVAGAFDDMKLRDVRFLEEASKFGPLTALLWSDEAIRGNTGKDPKFPENERLYFLRALRYVHEARLAEGSIAEDGLPELAAFRNANAIWVVKESDAGAARENFCKLHGLQYRVLREKGLAGVPPPVSPPDSTGGRKRVIVTGCYDWFHSGHVRFFEEAASYGDLYVVVGHDANIRLLKGEGRPLFPQDERRYVVGSIRFVKQSLISTGDGWLDAEPEIKQIKPDIYLVNEDGDVPEKRNYCQKHGLEYVVLKRKPAPGLPQRSSTDLRGY